MEMWLCKAMQIIEMVAMCINIKKIKCNLLKKFHFQSENKNHTVDNNICHLYRNEVNDKNSTKARREKSKYLTGKSLCYT